jgi:hypothetical protein
MKSSLYTTRSLRAGLLAVLLAASLAGCDAMAPGGVETGASSIQRAAKTFEEGIPKEVTFTDKAGATWTIAFEEASADGDNTTFRYSVSVSGAPSTGSFIAMEMPSCATYVGSDPAGNLNANANGTLEWHYNSLGWTDGVASFSYAFAGNVPTGLVRASFKSGGTGSSVETQVIAGPCQGRYTISGSVLLDEPGESTYGISGVTVNLLENAAGGGYVPNTRHDGSADSARVTDGDGRYRFEVWGPPFHSGIYQVKLGSDGANAVLHDARLFTPLTPLEYDVDVVANPANDFIFEVNVDGALDAFDQGTVASDGMPRAYWRVQATGKGSPRYQPELTFEEVEDLLTAFSDAFDVAFAFGDDGLDRMEAAEILKVANVNDPLEALRTGIVVLGLNYAEGRGMCEGLSFELDGRCTTWDEPATRLILEHAIGALRNAGYQVASKAPSGSTETTTRLVSEVNNDG